MAVVNKQATTTEERLENQPMEPVPSMQRVESTSHDNRVARVVREELNALHLRLRLAHCALFFLPRYSFTRLRTALYRLCGLSIGARSLVLGTLDLHGTGRIWERFHVGTDCLLNVPLHADLGAEIRLGNHVAIGHHVIFVTTDHEVGPAAHRCGASLRKPITIEDGCWIGAGVTILPGVTIGHGSIVSAGSVVGMDVPPNKLVGGVPARIIKALPEEN